MVDLKQLARIGATRKYSVDDVFFYQGDPGKEMFILLTGTVGVFLNNIDGSSMMITRLSRGNFFGEMSLLEGAPRSATIQALEDCMVLVINKENFEGVVSKQPQFAFRLLKVLSSRIRSLNDELMKDQKQQKPSLIGKKQEKEKSIPPPRPIFAEGIPEQKTELFQKRAQYQDMVAPETDNKFLFDKEVNCPCCDNKFTVQMVRTTIIPLERIENDLRERYKGFEPLWYMLWGCPHCGYTNFYVQFLQANKKIKEYVQENSSIIIDNFTLVYSNPRNLYEVFDSYYQFLFILENSQSPSLELAKVWLRLSWLYRDAGDVENERFTMKKALHYYRDAYFNTNLNLTPRQDARMNLLMGELFYQMDERKEALRIFRNTILVPDVEMVIKQMAENRVESIREEEKRRKEEEEQGDEGEEEKA